MACEFIVQLSKLRKLSAESVENTKAFNDPFKKYLHVERQVEVELRNLLRQINMQQKKCLVLLCGSAGDGKSHLISYLKNSDQEGLLHNYELYNDATESSEPKLRAIDTLAKRLEAFNDENYNNQDEKKMIIAINLGTLNNFIESEKGKTFSSLRRFVEENGIFSDFSKEAIYHENSVFQYVSFSDYQVFSLGEGGTIETDFLESLFEKIFRKSNQNPFYYAYIGGNLCSISERCPIRHNFEFLSSPVHQKAVIQRIIEAVIMDKTIVSTREILNLLYDLIVPSDFEESEIQVGTSGLHYLSKYILWTTPMLLSEFEDVSPLLNMIRNHDVLKRRSCAMDESATKFHSLESIEEIFNSVTEDTPYKRLRTFADISGLAEKRTELKKIIYRFLVRLQDMGGKISKSEQQIRLDEYIKYVYFQTSGNEKKLGDLYEAMKQAILNWNGQFENNHICIDDSNDRFWILEQLQLKSVINKMTVPIQGRIQRFSPVLKLGFIEKFSLQKEAVEICVDFSLFELISNMKEGYRPTVQDKNKHTDFVSFVQRLIEYGDKATRILIVSKDNDKNYKAVFEETDFGFKFGVER